MCVINWWRDEPSACRYSAVETHKIYVKNVRAHEKCFALKTHFRISEKQMWCEKNEIWLTVAIHFHFRLPLFSFGVAAAREMCFMVLWKNIVREMNVCCWYFTVVHNNWPATRLNPSSALFSQLYRLWKCQKYFFTFFIRALAEFVCRVCFSLFTKKFVRNLNLSCQVAKLRRTQCMSCAVDGRVQCIFNLFLAVSRINFIFNNLLPFYVNVCVSSRLRWSKFLPAHDDDAGGHMSLTCTHKMKIT